MSKPIEAMSNRERFEAAESLPFYSVGITKAQGAVYLDQYRLSQWLAASRGLLGSSTDMASRPPRNEEFPRGYLDEDDEMVLARLRKAQASLEPSLSRLDQDLRKLRRALLSTRKRAVARTSLVTVLACGCLSVILFLSRRGHIQTMEHVPRRLQLLIPLLPSPIAILLVAKREWQIRAITGAISRVETLRATIRTSQSVSPEEITWLKSEEWAGVNWGLVGL